MVRQPPGCRGWWRPPGVASRCNLVPLHVPLSGALCFFDTHWSSESSCLVAAHEGTTGLGVAAATESPQVAGSRRIHVRCCGTRSHLVYVYWRFDDAYVRLATLLSSRRHPQICRFSSVEVQPLVPQLLNVILVKIGVQNSLERTAKNDFLMHCMCAFVRVPFCSLRVGASSVVIPQVLRELSSRRSRLSSGSTSQSCRDLSTSYAKSLQTRVIRTSINTSSKVSPVLSGSSALPCQTQSWSLSQRSSSVHRNPTKGHRLYVIVYSQATAGALTVAEYIPYVFKILAQMLTLHQGVPVDYHALLLHLLTPAIWAQKGSIPGLVALLRAFLAHDAAAMVEVNQHTSVLGIVQQRLVPSKTNDGWGFELLQSIVLHVPSFVHALLPAGGVDTD